MENKLEEIRTIRKNLNKIIVSAIAIGNGWKHVSFNSRFVWLVHPDKILREYENNQHYWEYLKELEKENLAVQL